MPTTLRTLLLPNSTDAEKEADEAKGEEEQQDPEANPDA